MSEKFPKLEPQAVIVWAFTLPWSDAWGVYPRSSKLIKQQCLPYFEYRLDQVEAWLAQLDRERLTHRFAKHGKDYILFHDHADFNPPGQWRRKSELFPEPPIEVCECVEKSKASLRFSTGKKPKNTAVSDPLAAVLRPPVCLSMSSSLSSPVLEEEMQEGKPSDKDIPPRRDPLIADGSLGYLLRLAVQNRILGHPRQIREHIDGWMFRIGAQEIEQLLTNNPGRTIAEIHYARFPINGQGQPKKSGLDSFMESQGKQP